MPAQLVALTEGPSILLDKPILLLGRHPECDIQIDSRKISRRHCCIAQVNDYLVVRDLGSTNGIRINGVRVLEGRLKADDELTIGGFRYRVNWDALGAPPEPPSSASKRPRADSMRRGRPVAGNDDALLEECDDPVPLPDPSVAQRPAQAAPAGEKPGTDTNAAPAPSDRSRSGILPEHLDLAPVTDTDSPGLRKFPKR